MTGPTTRGTPVAGGAAGASPAAKVPVQLGAPSMLGGVSTVGGADRKDLLLGMRTGEIGMVHSWELVTAVDGPGTRMTTFLSGCPLRCLYCHNPDTLRMRDGKPVRAEDLIARYRRYRNVFKATRGGITISGGEVLMQPAFAHRLLRGAKELGIHTALDTSGFLGANASDELLADVDLVLLDIKSGLPETYKKVTGRELAPTLEFARRLADKGIEIWLRFVLVPGLTDADENIAPIVEIASSLPTVSRVEVLPFHQMGRDKWERLGLPYQLDETRPPEPAVVDRVRGQFRARGLTTY